MKVRCFRKSKKCQTIRDICTIIGAIMYETVIQAKTTESKTLRFVWYIVIIGGIIGHWSKCNIEFKL